MKNLKTKTPFVVILFILSVLSVSAQIAFPKNNTIENIELKKNQFKNYKLITGGNQGFVYQDGTIDKKIPNAEIIFTSEDGIHTQKVITNSYGRYKIQLKPARYMVTVKHKGYKAYSTAPGFSVINEKIGTFIIPLKKLSKFPIKRKTNKN